MIARLTNAFSIVALVAVAGCFGKTVVEPANPKLELLPASHGQSQTGLGDPEATRQWTVDSLGLTDVWRNNPGTYALRVAVLSSGVDYLHPDLRDNIAINQAEENPSAPGVADPRDGRDNDNNGYVDDLVGYDVVDGDGLPLDTLGFGTAMAGVIAAVHDNGLGIRGIIPKARIVPVRYLAANGQTDLAHLMAALKYAAAAAVDLVVIHMANIEFGIVGDDVSEEDRVFVIAQEKAALAAALAPIVQKGTPVIVSAGSYTSSPLSVVRALAGYANVFVVTSVDATDHRPVVANFGMDVVDSAAPGEGVYTTLPNSRYGLMNGTYIAAAHVAGAAAWAMALHPGKYTAAELWQIMRSAAAGMPVPAMEFETLGGNRLHVARFLAALTK